jgi:GAF domain-containing protein
MPLAELERLSEAHLAFLERAKNRDVADLLRAGVIQPMRDLEGRTEGAGSFDGDGFREAEYLARYAGNAYYEAWLRYAQIRSAYLFDQRDRFAELAPMLEVVRRGVPTHAKIPETTFYAALMRIALSEDARDDGERREHIEELVRLEERLERWARCGPANVMHKWLLVQAERARVEGRRLEAMDLYERAIALAGENGYINNQALANELYGRFWLGQGRGEIGALFLGRARALYEEWGAHAKAAHLRERHPAASPLMPSAPSAPAVVPDAPRAAPGPRRRADALDWMTVLRAGQAIASEMELERVIDRLMRIMIHSAGAARGVLILAKDGELRVEASIDAETDVVSVGPSVSVDERSDLPRSVIQYVGRTREAVVLGSAGADARFAGDPYLAVARPKSMLCAALLYQGKVVGVLYLENHLAEGVFGDERIELVEVLAAQAAVAVQNAMLYEHLQSVTEDLRESKRRLEDDVRERTQELRRANEQLALELEERQRAESVRAALQEEMIRMQREQLVELSTPLIPVTERIMVMPLVGTMDQDRASQVRETALKGAAERRAQVVILDVTGLRRADASVVRGLIQAATALRLLGAEAVMTGVRADMARTFVDMGVEMSGILTKGTLQSGIAHALRRTGERPVG